MKANSSLFSVVVFIVLYQVVLFNKFMDEILKCDHSNEKWYCPFIDISKNDL